jgi:CMP-N-acetylneuraminic acid synthetase
MTSSIIAIIPARGGSKGIPKKNIRKLNGIPLIRYSVMIAKKANIFDEIIVSTDSEEIAEMSEKFGASVIHRPKELAQDNSSMVDVVLNVLHKYSENHKVPEIFVLLQPTSPLRIVNYILECITLFKEIKPDVVMSVCEFEHNPSWSLKIENQKLIPIFEEAIRLPSRQQLQKYYRPNGSIYVSSPEILKKTKSFFTQNTVPYIMPVEHSIDIDSAFDFKLAEFILKEGGFDLFGGNK